MNDLIQSRINPNRIFVAVNSGLWSILKNGKEWIDEGQILEIYDQPTSLLEDTDGSIWMGTFSSGLYRVGFQQISTNNSQLQNPVIERFNNTNGLIRKSDWIIGLSKTGFIQEAGKCLVMQAMISGQPMIIVLLKSYGSATRIADANRIRKWIEKTSSISYSNQLKLNS